MRATVDGHGTPYFTTTFRTVLKNLLETNINYDEEAAEALYDCELTLFQQVTGTVDSVCVDLQIICPRCKTKTTSTDRLVCCSNSTCSATLKSKVSSIRADITMSETDGTNIV
ncbi:unnamed protein product [Adineta ricciae]|uniref:Uncharacterized protein n=1 Tax=Adineta ricciae TaxID=249248 RepID=A0A815RR32_ADIRI|nr:unnamed protein product [Adineta ricciae]